MMRLATGAVVLSAAAVAAPSAGARSSPVVAPTQALVSLDTPHGVYSAPRTHGSKRLTTLLASRPLTGGPTVLPVVGRRTAANRARWLRVMIPGRPNGRRGWIAEQGTSPTSTTWHLIVRTSTRRVLVYRHGRLDRSFAAIVGKPSTPTPHGRFFVEESVRMTPGSAGGPFALVLSARSNVLQEFNGGQGQVAIHGLQNLGGTLGTAISHGCVRLANSKISWLAGRIAAGTPVTMKP
jgi:lipoprotein-anchoring transpeptidase ErfK/SrfK